MVQAFLGDNAYLREKALEHAISAYLGPASNDPLARTLIYAGDNSGELPPVRRAIQAAGSVSMFAPVVAVIIRHCERLLSDELRELAEFLRQGNPDCGFFVEGEKIDGRSELGKVLVEVCGKAGMHKYELPKAYQMAEWLQEHARNEWHRSLSPEAASLLSQRIGPDPATADAEFRKLVLFRPDAKDISIDDVRELVMPQRSMAAFELQRPFGLRDVPAFLKALRSYFDATEGDSAGIPAVSALFQHAIRLLRIQDMASRGIPSAEMARVLKIHPYVFTTAEPMEPQAQRWPQKTLMAVAQRLADMDWSLKNGGLASRAELELAIAALVVR